MESLLSRAKGGAERVTVFTQDGRRQWKKLIQLFIKQLFRPVMQKRKAIKITNSFLIFALFLSSCSPVFRHRDSKELSQKLNWQAFKNRLEVVFQDGNHLKLAKVEMSEDSLYYQPRDSLTYHTVAYKKIKYLRFKNYQKSVFWGISIGLSLGILQWNSIASGYEGESEKVEVPLIITGMYIFLGALIGSVIGIPLKVTPESIQKITNTNK